MFNKVTPETVGISSEKILDFIKTLDSYRMKTHSIIMAKGNSIVAEGYYKPFDENFLHRMYSVSKSFVAMAVGLAYTEGLLSLDDKILDYLPEYRNDTTDEGFEDVTIRNMLSMQSNVNSYVQWWGVFDDRIKAYYTLKTGQNANSLYFYDSMGSFLLGCIVERLTGKTVLDYLKDAFLLDMGFSKESYMLYEEGGHTVGDSGVVCTARDLLIFAKFIMNKGVWKGRQIISREFMENAISKQTDNDIHGHIKSFRSSGYGYLIWKTHEDGFSLIGMGDQLAVCDLKKDFIFIITSDNQADTTARSIIFHELYKNLIPSISDSPIEENPIAEKELVDYLNNLKLFAVEGEKTSSIAETINGKIYSLNDNQMKFDEIAVDLFDNSGIFSFVKEGKRHDLEFGLCENIITQFSDGLRTHPTVMGKNVEGAFDTAASGAWTEENKLSIKAQIIDNYFGCVEINLSFINNRVTLLIVKSGQYVLDGIDGYAMGIQKADN